MLSLRRSELYRQRNEAEQRIQQDAGVTAALAAAYDAECRFREALKTDPACAEVAGKLAAKQEAMTAMNADRPDWKDRGAWKRYSDQRRQLAEEVQRLQQDLAHQAATSEGLAPLRAASAAAADAALKIYAEKLLADADYCRLTGELEAFNAVSGEVILEQHQARMRNQEAERKKAEEARKQAEEAKRNAAAEKRKAEKAKKATEAEKEAATEKSD